MMSYRSSLLRHAVNAFLLLWASACGAREYRPDELTAPLPVPTVASSDQVNTKATPSEVAPTPTVTPTPTPAPAAPTPPVAVKAPQVAKKPPIKAAQADGANSGAALRLIVRRLKMPLPLSQARIVIVKSEHSLELWNGLLLVKRYGVALGLNPNGPKQRRGDNRTPEGRFFICTRNDRTSAFHIFLGLSYPDAPDIERGLRNGQLSARDYQLSRRRLASRGAPLWETALGGWVGIHGGNDSPFAARRRRQRGQDWTAGCIALSNRDIEELFAATRMGTPVEIRP